MNKNYLITLKPMDWFFFGGERTHGEGDKSDYLAKSNHFPQQSAILGLLRYQLLKQNNLLSVQDVKKTQEEISKINDLIGNCSFNMVNISDIADFKKIKKLSPVCITKVNPKEMFGYEFYSPVPLDDGYGCKFVEVDNLYLNRNVKDATVNSAKIIDDGNTFDHKVYNNYDKWQSGSGKKIMGTDIWMSKMKIGITKQKDGDKSNEKNFYKQEYLLFKDGFVYAFFAELEEELKNDKVFIGGQRSMFSMDVIPVDDSCVHELYKQNNKANENADKIVLISDCFVEDLDKLNRLCLFHWSDSVSFRNIETTTDKNNYYIKPKKSEVKYHFLKRGSVLYFEKKNRTEVKKTLNNTYLQTIGYNLFI
jgi:CRISPR type III-B/RAMP module-associated protein Cmr3